MSTHKAKPQKAQDKEQHRMMGWIRTNFGRWFMIVLLVLFAISVFAGLGSGMFDFGGMGANMAQGRQTGPLPAVLLDSSGELKDTVMRVNGREVDREYFQKIAARYIDSYSRGQDDPSLTLMAYGAAAGHALRQEFVLQLADEMDVKVTKDDINEAKNEIIVQFMNPETEADSGNILGDFAKKLGSNEQRKEAFERFLQTQGITEKDWLANVGRELRARNTEEKLQEEADEKKKVKMNEKRALIDEELASGKSFADVVREHSEDPDTQSIANGGDVGTWVFRGLLTIPEQEEVLFAAKKGEVTDWIEIPAGLQKFEVYDKVEASGPEFEAAKTGLISDIKAEKGADYTPTDEEIVNKYEKVKFRKLQLSNEDMGAADLLINERFQTAKIEINDPYVLAYQALFDQKLQPLDSMTFERLSEIAKLAPVSEGYNYELIQAKLENGKPKTEEEVAAEKAEAEAEQAEAEEAAAELDLDTTAAADEAAAAEDTATADEAAADDPAKATEEIKIELPDDVPVESALEVDASKPAYALAVGLLTSAVTSQGEDVVGYFPYQIIGDVYMQWLGDDTVSADQPLDRTKAREEIEKYYARSAERNEYNAMLHANRGLNLAWLERAEDAKVSLDLAMKYAPEQLGGPLDKVKEAYEVLSDDAGLQAVNDKLDAIRQEQLRQQLEQAMQQQQEQGGTSQLDIVGGPQGGTSAADETPAPPAGEAAPEGDGSAAPEEGGEIAPEGEGEGAAEGEGGS